MLESVPWDHLLNPTEVIFLQTDDLSLSRVVLAIKVSFSRCMFRLSREKKTKGKEGAAKLVLILMLA